MVVGEPCFVLLRPMVYCEIRVECTKFMGNTVKILIHHREFCSFLRFLWAFTENDLTTKTRF